MEEGKKGEVKTHLKVLVAQKTSPPFEAKKKGVGEWRGKNLVNSQLLDYLSPLLLRMGLRREANRDRRMGVDTSQTLQHTLSLACWSWRRGRISHTLPIP